MPRTARPVRRPRPDVVAALGTLGVAFVVSFELPFPAAPTPVDTVFALATVLRVGVLPLPAFAPLAADPAAALVAAPVARVAAVPGDRVGVAPVREAPPAVREVAGVPRETCCSFAFNSAFSFSSPCIFSDL